MPQASPIRSLIAAALGICLTVSASRADVPASDEDIVVLRSDAQSVLIEYRPQYTASRTIEQGGRKFLIQEFAGMTGQSPAQSPGSPDIRSRAIPLAFPTSKGNVLRVVAADFEELRGAPIAPVPLIRMPGGLADSPAFEPDPQWYGERSFLPAAVAELSPVGRVRELLLGSVRIYPLQCNPSAGIVRRYSRIVVEVVFGPPEPLPRVTEQQSLLSWVPLNYASARLWGGLARSAAAPSPGVLAAGDWYRLTVTDDGMYRLDANYFAAIGVNLSTLDPRTIKVYGNGGKELSENPLQPRPADLTELAIFASGEGDGRMDAGDFVAFYGRGVRGWTYDPAQKTLRHYINHYADVNYYWLTAGGAAGKRMADQPSLPSSPGDLVVERFTDGVAVEEEKFNILGSGKSWVGQSLEAGNSFTHMHVLPNLVPNDQIRYRYSLVASALQAPSFTVRENGSVIGVHALNPTYWYVVATSGVFTVTGSSSLPSSTSQLAFQFNAPGVSPKGWIDWIEILYPRMLWAVGDFIGFRGPDTTAIAEYRLQQFSATPMIFNVTSHADVKLVSGITGSFTFRAAETSGGVSEYRAVAGSGWKIPGAIAKVPNQDLHGYAAGADFIIVTSPEYRSAADRLKAYREDPAHGGLKTLVADVNLIYNEFGGGIPDITAIRDFLKYAYDNWTPRPQFVLLMGQASYDYKGIRGVKSSYVPTWQSPESYDDVYSYCTDDFFVKFGASNAPSLVLGRVSARTLGEAEAFVDKLNRYEANSAADSWKMRMLFIGDDAWTSEGGEIGDRTLHSDDTETLAQGFTPEEFEKKKIYIAEYPTVYAAQGRRKPAANKAIIDQINQGVLISNYTGHGNDHLLAHEDIFDVATSIPQLVNADRLTVFILATCNFSELDDPEGRTGSEYLINKPDGGCIGVISATRKVFAPSNAWLNQQTYRRLFGRDAIGRLTVERPATALFLFKLLGNDENDQKFFYMGDPTMRLQFPRGYATIDSINGERVDSVGGAPRITPIQLRSLARVTVSGTVRNTANQPDPSFRGRVVLAVNDATRRQTIVNFYPGTNWDYTATGGTIYRGVNSVAGGRFNAAFIVPKDIQYADSTSRGRLIAYLSSDDDRTLDGQAYTGLIRIGGTDSTTVNDYKGPTIAIYLGNRSFRPGDLVGENTALVVDLADSSGINTSVSGIGHRIEAWVNSESQSRDLTDAYTSRLDDFRQGTVQFALNDLPRGKNSIRVRAWDSFNNSATAESFFEVASSERLTVTDVFNFPNPFGGEGTDFTFRQNQSSPLSVTIKVFTLAGRLIMTLEETTPGDSFVRVRWDGRDRDGDVIANGVYLYKLVVKTIDGRFTSEILGKLSKIQ
ncbi:MAG: type IX secretion system sortase PorU [Bacteroidota bacterium]